MAASVVRPESLQQLTNIDACAESVAKLLQRNAMLVHLLNGVGLLVSTVVLLLALVLGRLV